MYYHKLNNKKQKATEKRVPCKETAAKRKGIAFRVRPFAMTKPGGETEEGRVRQQIRQKRGRKRQRETKERDHSPVIALFPLSLGAPDPRGSRDSF